MAGLILLFLIALMILTLIVMLIMRKGVKRILLTFVGFIVVLGLYNEYVKNSCYPKSKEVEIMTPQAEVITDYILKNGIPKSLADIPKLPYSLEECERIEKNIERCNFNNKYELKFDYLFDYLEVYNRESETGLYINFKKQSNGTWLVNKKITPYSTKNDGICNPLRM